MRSAAERVSCGEARGATAALRLASEVAAPLRDYREDPPAPGPTLTSSSPGQLTSLEKSVNDTTSSRVYLDTEGFDSCGRPFFRGRPIFRKVFVKKWESRVETSSENTNEWEESNGACEERFNHKRWQHRSGC